MNLFDRIVDNFSMKELGSRVTAVIIVGLVICAAAAFALYAFLTSGQTISITGVGSWEGPDSSLISISLPAEELGLMEGRDTARVVLDEPSKGPSEIEAKVISINPGAPSVLIEPESTPEGLRGLASFDVRVILVEGPMWRLLWRN